MDAFGGRALDALVADVRTLLPDPGDPDLTALVHFDAVWVRSAGLGGYVGPQEEPPGDITGRRVDATVAVAIRGSDDADLSDRAVAVTGALLTVTSGDATAGTFLRVAQVEPGAVEVVDQPGQPALPQQVLRFDIVYELLEGPADRTGVIAEIPMDVFAGQTGRPTRRLPPVVMVPGVLDAFEVVDDAGAGNQAPSDWAFDPDASAIVQRSSIWGGTTTGTANLPGTVLLLRSTPAVPTGADVLVRADVASDERGIGLVFRWQDPDNFYYLLFDATDGFRRIGRKVAGTFGELAGVAVDTTTGYPVGTPLRLALEADGDRFTAHLGGRVVVEGRDPTISEPGRVGLLTRRNSTARFSSLEVWLL
jgi:hypothetical protein